MKDTDPARAGSKASIGSVPFGKAPDGTPVDLYRLTNCRGLVATITNYGGIVVSLLVPDRQGKLGDVVLGYDSLAGYLAKSPYFGCLVGRYGNRIAKGEFKLDGRTYSLAKNDGENHLHGGRIGFDKVVWSPKSLPADESVGLQLQYLSKDGEEGYPGALSVTVTYTLSDRDEFIVDYLAFTDKATLVNLTHHSYFNLDGADGDTLDHLLTINADAFTPVDRGLIPTGEVRTVKGTPMDFTRPKAIGTDVRSKDRQLVIGHGYDHNWILARTRDGDPFQGVGWEPGEARSVPLPDEERPPTSASAGEGPPASSGLRTALLSDLADPSPSPLPDGERVSETDRHRHLESGTRDGLSLAARLVGPKSGRVMEILTTEPGIQFYGGGQLDGTIVGKQAKVYGPSFGLCLETQHYPNSPNQADFPSTVLRPGETYRSRTVHKFSVARR